MNTREKVLKEALNCVNGEREKQYGNPEDNFERIADLWSVYLTSLFEDEKIVVEIDPIDVAKMMILFKIARSNGDKDKMDNYVDMIGYGACAAEIFENQDRNYIESGIVTNKEEFEKCAGTGVCLKEEEKKWFNDCDAKKDKPDEKCNRKDCEQFDSCMTAYQHYIYNRAKEASETIDKYMRDQKDPYSYFHDKLSDYVSVKAKEEHVPLDKLKDVNRKFPRELSDYLHDAVEDCVINGKKLLDCYKEIDELFEKYTPDKDVYISFWDAYNNISAHIALESSKANVNPMDVADNLIRNGHALTEMASLLQAGKLNFDDVAAYVDDAINEVKKEGKNANNN